MAPVRLPGARPRELEMVAVTGGSPTASSTGKVTRVPEPTTALIEPAARPARATATISHPVIAASVAQPGGVSLHTAGRGQAGCSSPLVVRQPPREGAHPSGA